MENLKNRIKQLKKKRPACQDLLGFYQKVREEQEKSRPSLKIESVPLREEWKDLLKKEGFSLLEKKDFPLDLESSVALFHSLVRIGKEATPRMAEQIEKMEGLLNQNKLNLKKTFREIGKTDKIADKFGLDKKVLGFFVRESIRPSIEAGVVHLHGELDPESWLKGYCPMCGSLPFLSLLKGEGGKRYLLCSFCGFQWRVERFFCPFCKNKDQSSLHYFFAEGEEIYRIDTCDGCHQYIKTFNARDFEMIDPELEDLATLHLDLLASDKGYKRPVPSPWLP